METKIAPKNKQLYPIKLNLLLTFPQAGKLARLANKAGCTKAAIIRFLIEGAK